MHVGCKIYEAAEFKGTVLLDGLRCNHPQQWCTTPWSGECYFAPHQLIAGRQWATPYYDWRQDMLAPREPAGEYISRACAA